MFSIIIPLYNKEVTIENTLNSVLLQSFKKYEVLVVDDGSTDLSLKIAESFCDGKIKVFSKKHSGVSDTRNYGIEKAKYEYIAFLDADDFWEPEYLLELSELIIKYPDCAMYGSAYKTIRKDRVDIMCSKVQEGIICNFFEERLKNRIMRTSATIVKKNVFDVVGGFPVGMIGGEDEYTWTKIALKYKVAFTPKVLVSYDNRFSSFKLRNGQQDNCKESWFDFFEEGDFHRNEFIAQKAIIAGIRYAFGTPQGKSREIERKASYTVLSKESWKYLFLLNRLPFSLAIKIIRVINRFQKLKNTSILISNRLTNLLSILKVSKKCGFQQEYNKNTH